tara:strand:- start:1587 stop:3686 length:2100 start_codon:yes stop_codon:yes gene_type:complete
MCNVQNISALEDIEDYANPLISSIPTQNIDMYEDVIKELLKFKYNTKSNFNQIIRPFQKKYSKTLRKTSLVVVYQHLLRLGKIKENRDLHRFLTKKLQRSANGILQITIMTPPGNNAPRWDIELNETNDNSEYDAILTVINQKSPLDLEQYASTMGSGIAYIDNDYLIVSCEKIRKRQVVYLRKCKNDEKVKGKDRILSLERKESGKHILLGRVPIRSCPYRCRFCPTEKTEDGEEKHPKSYRTGESAVDRGFENNYNISKQFFDRMRGLETMGHIGNKLVVRIAGGTWDAYTKLFQERVVRDLFYSANVYPDVKTRKPLSMEEEIHINETASSRIVELSIETRPDLITREACVRYRRCGFTAIELGIQHTCNDVLALNQRDATIEDTIEALRLLRMWSFKVCGHIMTDMYGSTFDKDMKMIHRMLEDPDLRCDRYKLYPTMVLKGSKLVEDYEEGRYKPQYETNRDNFMKVNSYFIQNAPVYSRIERFIRDMPYNAKDEEANAVLGGVKEMNLAQILKKQFHDKGIHPMELRSREPGSRLLDINEAQLFETSYRASNGTEYFLSFETPNRRYVHGFLKLRFNDNPEHMDLPFELKNRCTITWLQVYGLSVPVGEQNTDESQHIGFGKRLIARAEKIALEHGYTEIADISGIGVREYYRKCGFELEGTYMVKHIKFENRYKNIFLIMMIFVLVTLIYFL